MSIFTHFIDSSMSDILWFCRGNGIYSRRHGAKEWTPVREFDAPVVSIDYTGEILKIHGPAAFALLENGQVWYSFDQGQSWQQLELDAPVKSLAAMKRYCDEQHHYDKITPETPETTLGDMQTLFLLTDNRIRCYAISPDLSFVFKGAINPVAADKIIGYRDYLMFISAKSQSVPILYVYNEETGIKKHTVSCPLKKVKGLVNFNNSPAMLLNWGKIIVLTRLPVTGTLYPFKKGSSEDFPWPNKIVDMICVDTLLYALLDNGEMHIGHPDLGWRKVRLPGDPVPENAPDDLGDMYNQGQTLLFEIFARELFS